MTASIAALVFVCCCQQENEAGPAITATTSQAADAKPNAAPTYKPALVDFGLFQPAQFPVGNWTPTGLEYEDVWFTSKDGTKINGWFFEADQPKAVILYAHGNAGNVTHRAQLMRRLQVELQVSVLVFDYRGYGRSKGIPTQGGMLDDARAARAFLAKKTATSASDLVLMGRSMGGAVVIQLAAEDSPKGLIVESTFSSLRDVADYLVPGSKTFVNADDLNSLNRITQYTGPLLHSHGDADQVIPYSQGLKLYKAAGSLSKRHLRVKGGRHNSRLRDAYYEQVSQFLAKL